LDLDLTRRLHDLAYQCHICTVQAQHTPIVQWKGNSSRSIERGANGELDE
jgi:hypothetical protein